VSEDQPLTATQQDLIAEFTHDVANAETLDSLMDTGVRLFAYQCFDEAIKTCWPLFRQRLKDIGHSVQQVVAVDFECIFWTSFSSPLPENGSIGKDVSDRIRFLVDDVKKEKQSPLIIVAIDDRESSWRKSLHPEYKSTRNEKPVNFMPLRAEAIEYLKNEGGFKVEVSQGMEADDILSSIAFRCKLRMTECVLITDDRDMMQCCSPLVMCYSPRRKYNSMVSLKASHGLEPRQIVDWLSMMGKDDAPSIAGIGETIAEKLLQKYVDFMGVYAARANLTDKKRAAVEDFCHSGKYFTAVDLHTLNKRLPIYW